jgi:hypothetical protein
MYLILSWRSFHLNGDLEPMPTPAATSALSTLAKRYKGESHVMYALEVEPHDTTWAILRPIFEGMVDAIRLSAAPSTPLILIPGTNYSRDVSGAITDPVTRTNVVYMTHPYHPWTDFQDLFGSAFFDKEMQVFVGEFGPDVSVGMTMEDVRMLLELTRVYHIGWAAWILDYQTQPPPLNLMKSETDLSPSELPGTTSEGYGTTVKAEMLKPPSVPGETVVIDDDMSHGPDVTEPNQWWYQGAGWKHCIDCNEPTVFYYNASQSWTDTTDDTAKLTFIGRKLTFFGVVAPWHGMAAVSIDGGTETMIDLYATDKKGDMLLWTSPLLAPGIHTFTLRATGDKNPASTGTVIVLDRVNIHA